MLIPILIPPLSVLILISIHPETNSMIPGMR